MSRRRRHKKQTLQMIWIVSAVLLSIVLIVGYKIGFKDSSENTMGSIAENNNEGTNETPDGEISVTPDSGEWITPTVTPMPQGPFQVYDPTPTPGMGEPEEIVTPIPEQEEGSISPTPVVDNNATQTPTENEVEDDQDAPEQEEQKMVALTFDDGPYPPVTNRILDLLDKYDSHATFFVMGDRMSTYADTVKTTFEKGNQIGNHTLSHKQLTKLTVEQIIREVEYSNELINNNAAVGDAYLRPPYGAKNDTVSSTVKVPMILWSVDSLDWSSKNKDAIYKEIMDHVKDGDIILMHDLYPTTADAMELVIPELIKQGYQLVTVETLLKTKGITPEAGVVYHNGRK